MRYPLIDPVMIDIGFISFRWYGFMYLAGFTLVLLLSLYRSRKKSDTWTFEELVDVIFYGGLGAVIGGRLGYMLFYNLSTFLENPLSIIQTSDGGMSFHGGFIGVIFALIYIARKTKRTFITVTDFLLPTFPLGLGFGRLGNWMNIELPGRITNSPLGVHYPCDIVRALNPECNRAWEELTRHPSPLYQAFTEGLLLFIIVWWYSSKPRQAGQVSAIFLIGYGLARSFTELFRAPDAHIGFVLFDCITMGQLLTLPMILAGIGMLRYISQKSQVETG